MGKGAGGGEGGGCTSEGEGRRLQQGLLEVGGGFHHGDDQGAADVPQAAHKGVAVVFQHQSMPAVQRRWHYWLLDFRRCIAPCRTLTKLHSPVESACRPPQVAGKGLAAECHQLDNACKIPFRPLVRYPLCLFSRPPPLASRPRLKDSASPHPCRRENRWWEVHRRLDGRNTAIQFSTIKIIRPAIGEPPSEKNLLAFPNWMAQTFHFLVPRDDSV